MIRERPEPILVKRERNLLDGHPLRPHHFVWLLAWSQWIAAQLECCVYLVGSCLETDSPRDIDVALVWPDAEFERRFGATEWVRLQYADMDPHSDYTSVRATVRASASSGVGRGEIYIDVRLCPESWWPEKPRLLLAASGIHQAPDGWDGLSFELPWRRTHAALSKTRISGEWAE